ncbi:MAG: tetratricopeptide repeat protein [Chloroflexota bacterium]
MRQKRRRVNWFLVIVLVVLIIIVSYVDRFIIPTVESPFIPTPTATREPESYISEAEGLVAEGKFIQAIEVYNEAIRLDPDNAALYIAIAQAQVFAGRYDEAVVSASNAQLLNPDNSMAYAVRGWALTRRGDLEEADTVIQEAIRLDPTNGIAHAYYAILLGNMFEQEVGPYVDPIEPAIEESNTAMALASDRLEARWARGYILLITGNLELAIQQYQAAIEINPNVSQIHLELGVVYRSLDLIDEAVQEYTLANTLNPSDPLPDLYSSRALAAVGRYSQAVQYAEDAVMDAPTDPYLRGNWAYMLYELNDWTAADVQFSLAIYGGQSEDGQTITPLPISGDVWVSRYYYTYAIVLALLDRCGDMLSLTQVILAALPADEFAVYNSEYARSLCENNTSNPTAIPTVSPTSTP